MKNAEQMAITDKLKSVLKQRGLTYRDLATLADIPESSLKKIFSGTDCGFSKLVQICDALELSFLQVASSIIEQKEKDYFSFTLEQELYFVNNIKCYLLFHNMFRNAQPPIDAAERLGIGETTLWAFLRKLEDFGLLETGPKMKVKFKVKGGLRYIKEGPLQKKILEEIPFRFADYLANGEEISRPVDSPFLRLNFGAMTPLNFKKFAQELRELHKNFSDISVRDRKYHSREELVETTWMLGLGNCSGLELLNSD